MSGEGKNADLYTTAVEQVRYEGQLLWQIFGTFLLPHTVLLAFLLQAAFESGQVGFHLSVFVTSVVGSLLCIPWAASFSRSSDFYAFRMAQARKAEPAGWNLLAEDGERFSDGQSVTIKAKPYRVHWLGRVLRTQRLTVPLLIGAFFLVYLGIAVSSGPWWQ